MVALVGFRNAGVDHLIKCGSETMHRVSDDDSPGACGKLVRQSRGSGSEHIHLEQVLRSLRIRLSNEVEQSVSVLFEPPIDALFESAEVVHSPLDLHVGGDDSRRTHQVTSP